jgi:uncharacterized membrane protein YeiH
MLFDILDILGTVTFAVSGVLTALHKRMDTFGIFIIAFVTAVGGGTLRDVLIGNTPVSWMLDVKYIYFIALAVLFALVFKDRLKHLRNSLFLFDTIGLGVFTIIGIEKGLDIGLHPIICIALGTMTACFGGVIRDILSNEIPIIFRKEIYATACIIGGAIFLGLTKIGVSENLTYLSTASIIILIRVLAIKYNLSLPSFYKKTNS